MQSRNKDIFVKSAYWGTWSRVLFRMGGGNLYQVEVDVTPINPQFAGSWIGVKDIRIRKHCTLPSKSDHYTHHLPHEVVYQMKQHLSQEQIDIILHADIYNLIDWERYQEAHNKSGGGVNLLDCNKTIKPIFRLGYVNNHGGDVIHGDLDSFAKKLKEDFGKDIYGKERLITGWIEIQSKGTLCVYITCNEETGVYVTHFIVGEGNEQYYTNMFARQPADWYSDIFLVADDHLGPILALLEIKADMLKYFEQVKLILEDDTLWGVV